MNRKYSGFTLVEMLIVMGIIIILIAIGIAAGRFAINRANDVAHESAADQLFVAVQSYLTDEREYPQNVNDWDFALSTDCTPHTENGLEQDCLSEYLSLGEFRGGTDATYYYWTDSASALVCVSLGGFGDEDARGFYCTGNAFGADGAPGGVTQKDVPAGGNYPGGDTNSAAFTLVQSWTNSDDTFGDIGDTGL